ncbi:MAG: ATP-dependent Clp protease proteolytic subunit [Eubacterium sp.]|nr:ATP-dependent Clp protease proteolytic subunit [Eubacterium sp.]
MKGMILKESSRGIDSYSPESMLLQERILFFTEEVNPSSADALIEYLLFLDKDEPGQEITLCINSPGGEVVSGLAVYDTIQMLKSPVRTICIGTAASMGAILFLAGTRREMLPHTKLMIHDPLLAGLAQPQMALQLRKQADQLMETRDVLGKVISEKSGLPLEKVYEMTAEDCFLTAEKAVELGLATEIIREW